MRDINVLVSTGRL